MIGKMEVGPWTRKPGPPQSRRCWQVGGIDVMCAGQVCELPGDDGYIWFAMGFMGSARTQHEAERLIDTVLEAVRRDVELPGDGL